MVASVITQYLSVITIDIDIDIDLTEPRYIIVVQRSKSRIRSLQFQEYGFVPQKSIIINAVQLCRKAVPRNRAEFQQSMKDMRRGAIFTRIRVITTNVTACV